VLSTLWRTLQVEVSARALVSLICHLIHKAATYIDNKYKIYLKMFHFTIIQAQVPESQKVWRQQRRHRAGKFLL
jgi:hypothetical protein